MARVKTRDFYFSWKLGEHAGYSSQRLVFAGEKWLVFRLDLQQVSRLLLVLPNIVRNRKSSPWYVAVTFR